MADTSDFRNGMVIELDGELYSIIYFQHVKPGKGGAFVRTKLKNVMTGAVLDRTFRAGERVQEVRLVRRPLQYSYSDGHLYYFMDMETYEMVPLSGGAVGEDQLRYLTENLECEGLTRDRDVLSVDLPQFVEQRVVETEPGVRGDTAQGATKPARLEAGAVVQVPLFIEEGDVVRVDRTEDKYLERVSS
jgi:elongation factor P